MHQIFVISWLFQNKKRNLWPTLCHPSQNPTSFHYLHLYVLLCVSAPVCVRTCICVTKCASSDRAQRQMRVNNQAFIPFNHVRTCPCATTLLIFRQQISEILSHNNADFQAINPENQMSMDREVCTPFDLAMICCLVCCVSCRTQMSYRYIVCIFPHNVTIHYLCRSVRILSAWCSQRNRKGIKRKGRTAKSLWPHTEKPDPKANFL